MHASLIAALLITSSSAFFIQSTSTTHQSSTQHQRHHRCHHALAAYGRGAEIWPPSNNDVVQLANSFPNNQLPPYVEAVLRQTNDMEVVASRSWKRPLSMILRRAAARAQSQAGHVQGSASPMASQTASVEKTPALLALCLVPFLKPLDALLAACLTGYLCLLHRLSQQPQTTSGAPRLPALPPQGHVPHMLSNPLGFSLAYSVWYDRWLRAGVLLGLVAPLAVVAQCTVGKRYATASLAARPLFFLSLQAVMESSLGGRVVLAPLPLRILTSVLFNVLRIGYVWQWSTSSATPMGAFSRILACLNMLYWSVNLFGFLIPVGVMRYMRAHFFCVEAEQVITRQGMLEF
ncbi:hypothetical protein MPSEU_001090500 [Mayamaea pseudoterrestris]|nr:hypothetical protein MPSEU_001090500 [Mayamaea pseudoterrestris]